jgi:hypothetical protein
MLLDEGGNDDFLWKDAGESAVNSVLTGPQHGHGTRQRAVISIA